MTEISVGSTTFQVEKRSWLLGTHGTGPGDNPSVKLDVSAFTAATHYPNGYLLSGIVLGKITATGLYAPYVDAAVDGTGTAAGILFGLAKIPNLLDLTKDTNGALFVHGFVDAAKLPIANAATGGGFLDANGRTDLKLIHFTN
jgi:hypothetical protein